MQCEESLITHIITGWVNNEFKYLGLCQFSETKKPLGRGLKYLHKPKTNPVAFIPRTSRAPWPGWTCTVKSSEFTSNSLQESQRDLLQLARIKHVTKLKEKETKSKGRRIGIYFYEVISYHNLGT